MGVLIAIYVAKADGMKKTFLCDNLNIIKEINTTNSNHQYGLCKISPINQSSSMSKDTKNTDTKSLLNNLADTLAKEAANSNQTGIFAFHPSLPTSDYIKRGNFHIHSAQGPIKPTTANIYELASPT
eukprot:TRINITY_DN4290_c0_g2_i1.p1 TRINITY_DN4290_c0_g2~~TRINITY_DN4290_c0_g2_i1.p1  ORF type:complete len:127 (-),score=19.59 TRINITY_DN4290_c0_g2_i1:157-537(-)